MERIEDFGANSAASENENFFSTGLKAFDVLNFLTREHLEEIFKEYMSLGIKHNIKINKRWMIGSCRELKTETTRFEELIKGFYNIGKDSTTMGKIIQKDGNKSDTSTRKKTTDPGNIDVISPNVLRKINNHHNFTIECFLETIKYFMVGFNKYRYDQCPNVKLKLNLIDTGIAPNKTLQETMMSLKITNEEMISEKIKEEKIRILCFGITQTREELKFHINIPEIEKCDPKKFSLRSSDTGVFFYVDNHKGKFYIFEVSNLAHKINRKSVRIDNVLEDSVIICVAKQKREFWKELFYFRTIDKELWEKEMEAVLETMNEDARAQMEPLYFVWNISLILVNCRADLLNLPPDLNHVNKTFETYEDMVFYYKTMIPFNPYLKALFYILGGALYKMTVKSSSSFKMQHPKKNVTSKYEEMVQEITERNEKHAVNLEEGCYLYMEEHFEEANVFFARALSFCHVPNTYVLRSACLLELRRFKEAFMDSIFGLRNLDSYKGFPSLLTLLDIKIKSGNAIPAIDMAISLEYKYKQRNENLVRPLKTMRRKGFCILNNIFKSYSLIFNKKYKEAIPFLEKAESIITVKSGHTSVILLLLHFIFKNYGEVIILGKKILNDVKIHINLVYYLIGMSSYYIKKLGDAINYSLNLKQSCLGEFTKLQDLRELIHKADDIMMSGSLIRDLMKGGSLVADVLADYYNKAFKLSKENDQLSALIFTKLGVLSFFKSNFKETVRYLTYSIDLVGSNKNILVLRAEAYHKLGMVNEARKDCEEVKKYEKEVQAFKDMELKKIRKRSI